MKLKEVFNKKRVNWTSEKEYDVGHGKADTHPASKILLFIPVGVVLSCLVVIVAVLGIPKTLDILSSTINNFAPKAESNLRGAADETLFDDVKADSKYFDSLAFLKKNGVISGYDDNTFRPYQELSRAELMKTIVNAKKQFPLALNYSNCFKDVRNEWYAPSVCLAKEKGWVSGYADGSFHPNETLTKAEALKMILEAFEIKKTPDAPPVDMFEDLDKDAWYYPYVEIALDRKLINENPNLEFYQPDAPAIRGDIAQIIYRVIQS